MSNNTSFGQLWTLADTQEYLSVGPFPSKGTGQEQADWRKQYDTTGVDLDPFKDPVFFISPTQLPTRDLSLSPSLTLDQSSQVYDVYRSLAKIPDLMERSLVYGECANDPRAAEKIELAFVVPKNYELRDLDAYRKLLRAGALGTPRHGKFSMSLVFDDCVWQTTADCLGFTRSSDPQLVRRAVLENACSWKQWTTKFVASPSAPSRAPKV